MDKERGTKMRAPPSLLSLQFHLVDNAIWWITTLRKAAAIRHSHNNYEMNFNIIYWIFGRNVCIMHLIYLDELVSKIF